MSATSTSSAFAHLLNRARPTRGSTIHRRRVSALVLTVLFVALGIVLVALYRRDGFMLYVPITTLGLLLLWLSTTSERFDERDDAVEDVQNV